MRCGLKKKEILRIGLEDGGSLLRCLQGALWITTGDGVDYLLSERCSLGSLAGKEAVVEALEESELQIEQLSTRSTSLSSLSNSGFRLIIEG